MCGHVEQSSGCENGSDTFISFNETLLTPPKSSIVLCCISTGLPFNNPLRLT